MAQIPNFRVCLRADEIERVLARSKYAHFLADKTFAPLDAELFVYRQTTGAQAVPDFVSASILSKKIAVGVSHVGLDVRIARSGNFGGTWHEGRQNARRFCRVAKLLGIRAVCFLTNGEYPYQPYIGRAEALQALDDVFEQRCSSWLRSHDNMCFTMAASLVGRNISRPLPEKLKAVFAEHLHGQGASIKAFKSALKRRTGHKVFPVTARKEGFLTIRLDALRAILTQVQRESVTLGNAFPDPCGVVLAAMPGDYVWRGNVIAYLRCKQPGAHQILAQVEKVFSFDCNSKLTVIEEVRDA